MKKVLLSLIVICLLGVLIAGGIFAYFAGTVDLKLTDSDETFRDGVNATWKMTNMIPGVTYTGASVTLKNSGSIAADHVEISFNHSIDETTPVESDTNPNSTASDLAKWIEITSMSYTGDLDLKNNCTDANDNGFLDLYDVTLSPNAGEGGHLDNLPAPSPLGATTTTLAIALRFNAGATNDIQGDTLTTIVIFTLNQVASQ